ncbi:DUF3368 domain-containing protein [Okeania sp. KiyG1]|uniref:DUF3368 domain-containing protein n=1 Tax=Okeania sp. KiyG1 TaxID=2720165 RepID=UPI0019222E3A|nr:DUF3368 domain-containing protein [Okeania sp. KiyG1]GGA31447.1 hypothetical protein CYANOKiyG1_48180 [Okeania sp. KiyG1]
MRNVISNTSPIQYLYQTNLIELLPQLYGSIILPQGVVLELEDGKNLGVAVPKIENYSWFQIYPSPDLNLTEFSKMGDILGRGEKEVMALGLEISDSLAIIDDGLARSYARDLGIKITGTVGVLLKAKQTGYLDLIKPVLEELIILGFYLDKTTHTISL